MTKLKREELIERLKKLAQSEPPSDLSPGACCYYPASPEAEIDIPCPKCQRGRIRFDIYDRDHPLIKALPAFFDKNDPSYEESSTRYFHRIYRLFMGKDKEDEKLNKFQKAIHKKIEDDPNFVQKANLNEPVLRKLSCYEEPFEQICKCGLDAELVVPEHCPICGEGLSQGFQLKIHYSDSPTTKTIPLENIETLETMLQFLQGKDCIDDGWGGETELQDLKSQLTQWFGLSDDEIKQ